MKQYHNRNNMIEILMKLLWQLISSLSTADVSLNRVIRLFNVSVNFKHKERNNHVL